MNELYNLLEQAVENQEQVKVIVGGKAFDVKLASASHTLEPPIEVADLTPAGSIGIEVHEVRSKTMDEAKRKAIEKAVVELGGKWPDEYEREPCLLRSRKCCLEGEGVYKASSFKKHEVSGNGLIFYEYICTREEFDQVKKKMKNNWRNTLEERPSLFDAEKPDYLKNIEVEQPMKYQYSVEYECNGVKPDLPDYVMVEIKTKEEPEGAPGIWRIGECSWLPNTDNPINSFRIVDEHYKPNLDELLAKEPKSNWHERGELPINLRELDFAIESTAELIDQVANQETVGKLQAELDRLLDFRREVLGWRPPKN